MKKFLFALIAVASCATLNAQSSEKMKVVAHRGGALIGNENTLSAFMSDLLEVNRVMVELLSNTTSLQSTYIT